MRRSLAPDIIARRPDDVLATVPYLLGFHPSESLVVIALRRPRNRVVCTMRMDLPPIVDAGAVAEQLLAAAGNCQASGVLVIAYSADVEQAAGVATRAAARFEAGGLPVVAVWRCDGSRWWCLCGSGRCCASEGAGFDPTAQRCAAEAVSRGLVALTNRAELAVSVAGPPTEQAAQMAALTAHADAALSAGADAARPQAALDLCGQRYVERFVAAYVRGRHRLTDGEVATLSAWLRRIPVRDAAWCLLEPAGVEPHIELWQQVTRRAAPGYVAAPAALLAFAAWLAGRGALSQCALDRVFAEDPAYSMGRLVEQALATGLPPTLWAPTSLAQLRAATLAQGHDP